MESLPKEFIICCKTFIESSSVLYTYGRTGNVDFYHYIHVCSYCATPFKNDPDSSRTLPYYLYDEWYEAYSKSYTHFVLPEKWVLAIWGNDKEVSEWREVDCNLMGYIHSEGRKEFNTGLERGYYRSKIKEGYTEITRDQFIEYVYKPWKKSKMKNKDFIITGSSALREAFAKESKIPLYTPSTISEYPYTYFDGVHLLGIYNILAKCPVFNLPEDWHKALEYVKQGNKESKKVKFGEVELTVLEGNNYAECTYGNVTKAELINILNIIENPPTLAGYRLTFEDGIKIGCQTGTVKQLKEILTTINSLNS